MMKTVQLSTFIVVCLVALSALISLQTPIMAVEKAPVLYLFLGRWLPAL